MSYAQFTVIGRVGSDPRTNTVGGKNVANFSVAYDCGTKDKPETMWIECAAWEKTADVASRFLKKGSFVAVFGTPRPRNYKDKNGAEVKSFSVNVQRLELGPKVDGAPSAPASDDSDPPF